MNFASKRKRDDIENDTKKTKNFVNEKERQEYTTSNEWPVYAHPDGGIVKFTPWGSLRQFQDSNGETVTKFEDMSFQDYAFNGSKESQLYETIISTPQQCNNQGGLLTPSPERIKLSPSDEAENYVINGYQRIIPSPAISNNAREVDSMNAEQFVQEHENYLGMEQQEEFEAHDNSYSNHNDIMM